MISKAAALERIRDGFGRFGVGGLRTVAAIVDVGDPDLAGVEGVHGHPPYPGKELDAGIEFRGAVAAIRNLIEERRLLRGRGADEVGCRWTRAAGRWARCDRSVDPREPIRVDVLDLRILAGQHVNPCSGTRRNRTRLAILDGDNQVS